MEQKKKIKQKWKEPKSFDICFSILFRCYNKSVISERETCSVSHQLWNFPVSQFSTITILKSFSNHEATRFQNLSYQKLSPALSMANQTYTKMLQCFILFSRLQIGELKRPKFRTQTFKTCNIVLENVSICQLTKFYDEMIHDSRHNQIYIIPRVLILTMTSRLSKLLEYEKLNIYRMEYGFSKKQKKSQNLPQRLHFQKLLS